MARWMSRIVLLLLSGVALGCRCGGREVEPVSVALRQGPSDGLVKVRGLSADGAPLSVLRALDGRQDTSFCLQRDAGGALPSVTLRLPSEGLPVEIGLTWEPERGPSAVEVALLSREGDRVGRFRADTLGSLSSGALPVAADVPLRRIEVQVDAPAGQDAVCLVQLEVWTRAAAEVPPVKIEGAWAAPLGLGTGLFLQQDPHLSGCTDDGATVDGVVLGREVWLRARKVGVYETRMTLVLRSDGHLVGRFRDDRNPPGGEPMLIDIAPARGLEVPCEGPPPPVQDRLLTRWLDGDTVLLRAGTGPVDPIALDALGLAVRAGDLVGLRLEGAPSDADLAALAGLGLALQVREVAPQGLLGPDGDDVLYGRAITTEDEVGRSP